MKKIVFHETRPQCREGWEPLQTTGLQYLLTLIPDICILFYLFQAVIPLMSSFCNSYIIIYFQTPSHLINTTILWSREIFPCIMEGKPDSRESDLTKVTPLVSVKCSWQYTEAALPIWFPGYMEIRKCFLSHPMWVFYSLEISLIFLNLNCIKFRNSKTHEVSEHKTSTAKN